jgi:hypothetical protein
MIAIIRLEKNLMKTKEICKKYETKITMKECFITYVFIRLQNVLLN